MGVATSILSLPLEPGDGIELFVTDLAAARALYEGSPAARLLARTRLAWDERDAGDGAREAPRGQGGPSTWEELLGDLAGEGPVRERVKRAVARQSREAALEGPLPASDRVVAVLISAVAAADDESASLAELAPASHRLGRPQEEAFVRRTVRYERRLAMTAVDLSGVFLEACARLTGRTSLGPLPAAAFQRSMGLAADLLGQADAIFPRALPTALDGKGDTDTPQAPPRAVVVDRADLDALVRRDPRTLAADLARRDALRGEPSQGDRFLAELARLLTAIGTLIVAVAPHDPSPGAAAAERITSLRPPSWLPLDWSSSDATLALALAVEHGALTLPRLRAAISRGGAQALDAVGAEMLQADVHPFASAAFADILARTARPRDVMRLVTYFAVAPDPRAAARALSTCAAPELPQVLSAWLETMLPADDGPAHAHLLACIQSLAQYPSLQSAISPPLRRVSDRPPA